MRTITLLLLLTATAFAAFSQTRLQRTWSNWMGAPYAITFRNGGPQDVFTITPSGGLGFPFSSSYTYEGSVAVAYADSLTGQLKFVASPAMVYNRNFDTVTNGYGLIACGDGTKNAVLVIPFPNGENKFYIVHQFPSSSINALPGLQTRCSVYAYITGATPGVRYSILDMDYNNGLGIVTTKNNFLPGAGGDKFAQIRHANGKDLWLVSQTGNSNTFTKTLFHQTGLQGFSPAATVFPTEPASSAFTYGGSMDASPTGNKIAVASPNNKRVNVYHFNSTTGDVSFDTSIALPDFVSELCFSPDGSKLYASTYDYGNCGSTAYKLYQIDLAAANRQGSVFEVYGDNNGSTLFQLQRTVGNRILLLGRYLYYSNAPNRALYHSIENPNQPQAACTFRYGTFTSNANSASHPNLPNDVVKQNAEAPATNFNFPKDTAVCFGSYTMTAPTGFAEYRWTNGQTTQSITVTKPGTYGVLAGPAGFAKPAAYGFTVVKAKAQPLNLGPDTLLCPKSSYAFNIGSNFTNLVWQNGDTSRNHTVSYPGGVQVLTAVDANGCRVRDSVCVQVRYNPRAEFGKDTTLCAGQTVTLRMEPMQIFNSNVVCLWQDGSTKDSLRVTAPGTYWGRVTYQGCTVSDTIKVSYFSSLAISLGRDTALCAGDSLRLSVAQAGLSYQWNTGATTQSIVVTQPGTYIVRATNGQCSAADTVVVTYKPRPQFTLGADRSICPYESTTFTAPISGAYLWSTGSLANSVQASQAGWYWLQVTVNGCSGRDSALLLHKPLPVVELGNDTTLCEGTTKVLNVFNSGATYLWSDGSTASTYGVTKPETVTVSVTLAGCVKRDTIKVQYNRPPFFRFGADTVICSGTSIALQPPVQNGNYLWQDGSTATNFTVKAPGLYHLSVTNQCGSAADSVVVAATLCELLMPNAFTPNGDGLNDVFLIKFPQYLKKFELTVYDRSGEMLYRTATPGQGWDGTYKGKRLRTETYVWKITYTDIWNNSETKWGTVTLIR